MKFNKISFNIAYLLALPISIYLCIIGKVDWWTFIMITILTLEVNYTWERR